VYKEKGKGRKREERKRGKMKRGGRRGKRKEEVREDRCAVGIFNNFTLRETIP